MSQYIADGRSIAESRDTRVGNILNENRSWSKKYKHLVGMLESSDPRMSELAKNTLMIMENQANYLSSLSKNPQLEATFTNNLGALVPRVIDLVRIFYPNLVANKLVDIQPMDRQNGEVFIVKPVYSNTAAGVTAGQQVFRYLTDGTYASAYNFVKWTQTPNGSLTTFTNAGNLPDALPIVTGTVAITVRDATAAVIASAVDDGAGNLSGTGVSTGTVDYTTGAISVTFSSAPASTSTVTGQFNWAYESSGTSIRELEIQLSLLPVTAQPHPLRVKWSTQAQLAASSHLDLDIPDVLTNLVASFIKQERDMLLINGIQAVATPDSNLDFNATPPTNYSKLAKYAEIELKLNYAESATQYTNGRGGVSWILCGNNAADIWRNAASFVPSGVVAPIGPHSIGTLRDGTVEVIKVPFMDKNKYITGFKGYVVGDAATILAEWIPLYASPTFQAPDLNQYQGMMSLYAIVQNNVSYYKSGVVSGYVA